MFIIVFIAQAHMHWNVHAHSARMDHEPAHGFNHCHVIEAGQVCSNIVHVTLTATVWAGQDPLQCFVYYLWINVPLHIYGSDCYKNSKWPMDAWWTEKQPIYLPEYNSMLSTTSTQQYQHQHSNNITVTISKMHDKHLLSPAWCSKQSIAHA